MFGFNHAHARSRSHAGSHGHTPSLFDDACGRDKRGDGRRSQYWRTCHDSDVAQRAAQQSEQSRMGTSWDVRVVWDEHGWRDPDPGVGGCWRYDSEGGGPGERCARAGEVGYAWLYHADGDSEGRVLLEFDEQDEDFQSGQVGEVWCMQ